MSLGTIKGNDQAVVRWQLAVCMTRRKGFALQALICWWSLCRHQFTRLLFVCDTNYSRFFLEDGLALLTQAALAWYLACHRAPTGRVFLGVVEDGSSLCSNDERLTDAGKELVSSYVANVVLNREPRDTVRAMKISVEDNSRWVICCH